MKDSKLSTPKVAFLWDESFLWGLMAYKALTGLSLPFDLIKAEDIKAGTLNNYKMLFVPGGWASNKIRVLGEEGVIEVQKFVSEGGSYLGFCGGAGLATTGRDGLGLVNIKRRPTRERVPSFSGRIELNVNAHAMWKDIPPHPPLTKGGLRGGGNSSPVFHAWWPSQFIVEDEDIKILATYGDAMPDAFSSDICIGDVGSADRWEELEAVYKINLNPARLRDEPAVIEGIYGKGKVILSLVHFDTPEDVIGQKVLVNLWEYLLRSEVRSQKLPPHPPLTKGGHRGGASAMPLSNIFSLSSELISLGERNFLWFWRNSLLLQWRRGVRGLEYNTLYIMMKEIAAQITEHRRQITEGGTQNTDHRTQITDKQIENIKSLLTPFVEKAKHLLLLERHALQKGHITYERCDDPEIQRLRSELFSESKSYGGKFKELLDKVDRLLYLLLIS
ncbi:MAG: hypothetical protein C4581_03060 [Nitrospiraceae bacterium]|nr:MAG: hypothetical protein C4581_03060 [Nitrospiraceae bacterium]